MVSISRRVLKQKFEFTFDLVKIIESFYYIDFEDDFDFNFGHFMSPKIFIYLVNNYGNHLLISACFFHVCTWLVYGDVHIKKCAYKQAFTVF